MLHLEQTSDDGAPWYMVLGGFAIGGFLGAKLVGGLFATAGGGLFGALAGDLLGHADEGAQGHGAQGPTKGSTATPFATLTSLLRAAGAPGEGSLEEGTSEPSLGTVVDVAEDPAIERAPILSTPVKASILAPGAEGLRFRPEVAIPGWGGSGSPGTPIATPPPAESAPAETPEERAKRLAAEAELEAAYNAMLKGEKAPPKKETSPKKTPPKEEGLPTLGKDESAESSESSRDGGSERSSEWTFDAARYNLAGLNAYRALHGVAPLALDARLSLFALAGSKEMFETRTPHSHFKREIMSVLGDASKGFGTSAAENQGDHRGMPLYESDPIANEKAQIDTALRMMHDEGPGGGHYETMVSPLYTRVGIAFVRDDVGRLFMTNDFSNGA